MNWATVAAVGVLCVAMVTAEGMLTSRDFTAWLNSLNRPRLYAPMPVWVAVAVTTYVLQGVIAYRLIEYADPILGSLSLLVLALLMFANVAYNVVLDRTRNPAWAYRGLHWFLPVLAMLQVFLFLADSVSALLNLAYVAWVIVYDVPIMRALARLNPSRPPQ